jgi:hypothetical protein
MPPMNMSMMTPMNMSMMTPMNMSMMTPMNMSMMAPMNMMSPMNMTNSGMMMDANGNMMNAAFMNNGMMGMDGSNVVPDANGMIPGMVPGFVQDMSGAMVPGMVPGLVQAPPEMLAQFNNGNGNDNSTNTNGEGMSRVSGEGLARASGEGLARASVEDGNKPKKSIAALEDTMKEFEKNLNDQGLSLPKSAPPKQQKQLVRKPSAPVKKDSFSASAAAKRVYHIPRYAVMLEDKPFAHGGGGQIFKGMYMGNEIAAKQVYDSKSGQAHSEDFDNEVAVLTKLSHPCILSCFGVTSDEDGSMYQVYCMTISLSASLY